MKKIFLALMMAATLLTAACKDDQHKLQLANTQWMGIIENDPEALHYTDGVLITHAKYKLCFNDEKNGKLISEMVVLVDGELGESESDWADFTYTFDGTANGTLTLDSAENYSFHYNADSKTIVLPIDADSQSELNASEIVFNRVI